MSVISRAEAGKAPRKLFNALDVDEACFSSLEVSLADQVPSRLTPRVCADVCCPRLFSAQSGVGLIEVLVAVLVLSIAFLGIAALQAMSLSTNNSAMARSMATIASYSIIDGMRADLANASSNAYDGTVAANACPAVATTGATLANAQLNQWCTMLGKSLGAVASTTGKVACSAVGKSEHCTVTIIFDDSRAGVGGTSLQTITTEATL